LFEKEESKPPRENDPPGDEGEDSLFLSDEDDFGIGKEISADQIVNEEGLMELRKTKERLEQQAKARREKLKAYKKTGDDEGGIQREVDPSGLPAPRGKNG